MTSAKKYTALWMVLIGIAALMVLAQASLFAQSRRDDGPAALLEQLRQAAGGEARIVRHAETGLVSFIGASPEQPIAQPAPLEAGATAEAAARGFLATYGALFGLNDAYGDLVVMRQTSAEGGRSYVRFQQQHRGVPVLAGEVVVQVNAAGDVISANGELLPGLTVDTTAAVTAEAARQTALDRVAAAHGLPAEQLIADEPALWLYNPALLGGPGPRITTLVWRLEVSTVELLPVRELVLVDARLGTVTLHFNEISLARNRMTYDANDGSTLPGTLVRNEASGPSGDADVDNAHDFAGDTYDFFASEHGRDSLDDAGMTLTSTTHYCPSPSDCPYANAFWNGAQMVYGEGYSQADDVVGHELTHGVTDFTSHLFYYYESGAINESLSDVWGEFVDLTNGAGNDSPAVRWLMGEDVPGLGAIRDMEHPPTFGDPDRMLSANYYCDDLDNGGVHINSGVNNKATFLMTDGGSFNGQTVAGLGISKVADLYYEVETNMLLSASDYQDLYQTLIQAGVNLGYSAAERQEILAALTAVEMNQRPCAAAADAPICPSGTPIYSFFDNLENTGSGNWAPGAIQGTHAWYYPPTSNPFGFDATYATSGVNNFWGYNKASIADFFMAMTSNVNSLPPNSYLHFSHSYGFENSGTTGYDGGVVEYSTNNGGNWTDLGSLFTHNGYNGTISNSFGNPLGGREAFVLDSRGYTSSRANLASLSGQNVRIRFRIGTDSSVEDFGWFIDDIRIYTCGTQVQDEDLYLPMIVRPLLLPTATPTPPPGSVIANGDFEAGPTAWAESSTLGYPLIVSTTSQPFPFPFPPHSGTWGAWLAGDHNETSIIQQQVTVGGGAPYLGYWHVIASQDTCGNDHGGVRINGTPVDQLNLCAANNSGAWTKRVVNLSAYAGQSVSLEIWAATNASLFSSLYIDDVAFQSTPTGAAETAAPLGVRPSFKK